MADLPQGYRSVSSISPKLIKSTVKAIHEQLKETDWQGNQWLVIRNTSDATIQKLKDTSSMGGVAIRFMWVGTTGLIKVVDSVAHGLTTSELRGHIDRQSYQMGLPYGDITWGQTVTTSGIVTTHGKQADECIYPRNRRPIGGRFHGWPTLVIETGVSESLAKLRRDATWWFQTSSGDTRIVLVISIKTSAKTVRFEKWQLASPTLPRPVTRQAIAQLRQQPNQMPPLVQQSVNNQVAFSSQEITVTPTSITGGPLVIPFQAVADRQPIGIEGDIMLNDQALREITNFV